MLASKLSDSLQAISRPPRLSEKVEEQLREAIIKQVFATGEVLPSEMKLAEIFNVSRNVIREALSMLSSKGYIEIHKGKGAFVLEPSIDSVFDPFSQLVNFKCGDAGLDCILAVRLIVEPEVVSVAAQHRTVADLEKLSDSLRMMQQYCDDKVQLSHWDIVFHQVIARSTNNPLFPIVLEPIFHVLATYHPPVFYDPEIVRVTLDMHQRIYQHILDQTPQEAFLAMQQHLKMAEEHNLRLRSHPKSSS